MPSIEDNIKSPKPARVLVIGASYGGLAAGLNLWDLCSGKPARFSAGDDFTETTFRASLRVDIIIVDERDGYYHLIGSPLALASKDYAAKAWTRFKDIPALRAPGISYIRGSVLNVDCENKVALIANSKNNTIREEKYDFLIASTGLRRAWPVVPQSLEKEQYLFEINDHIDKIRNGRDGVVIIGGGAVGIEMAAELKLLEPLQKVTLIHSRERLLSSEPLPDDFKDSALSLLQESGVKVVLGRRVTKVTSTETKDGSSLHTLYLDDGTIMVASNVIMAVSKSVPSTSYLPGIALDREGYVRVSPTLNFVEDVPNAGQHFAIGDIAAWSGIKRCGGAMYMGHTAALNIYQQLLQKRFAQVPKFVEIPEFPAMIALAVGKKAVLYGPKDGTTSGEDLMQLMFGNDLGFTSK